MNRKIIRMTRPGLLTLIIACSACQNNETQGVEVVEDNTKGTQAVNERDNLVRPAAISMDEQIKGAMTDLATRTGVAEDAITVREARSVQWGSGAIGCPKPGMNYTQALVPGVLLLLEVNGTIYHYHGSDGRSLFFCPPDRVRAPAYGQGQEIM